MWGNLDVDEGNYAESLNKFMRGLKLAQEVGDIKSVVEIERTIGYLYAVLGEYEKAISYGNNALEHAKSIGYKMGISNAYNALGETFIGQGNYTASLEAFTKGLVIDQQLKDSMNTAIGFGNVADALERIGNYDQALFYVSLALNYFYSKEFPRERVFNEWVLGRALLHTNNPDSGLYYGKRSLMLANKIGYRLFLPQILQLIAESAAKLKMYDTAYKYQLLSSAYKDTLTGQQTARKITMLHAQIELDKKQAQIALKIAENRRDRLFLYVLLSGLGFIIALAVILFRNNRLKQRANILLQKQKREIDIQKQKVEHTFEELKSTQSQLIQSEKEKMLAHHHKELLNLEARALRAQMNPHFIYNCMNSIKALIQSDDKLRSIEYLTTFSKLIRTIFHNSDKRQISLLMNWKLAGFILS
jgi:tetratricopeptide (TPR) repeat protein